MFDFAWSEIALIGVVALIAIGPKDLPVAIKTVAELVKKARRMASEFQTHVDEMVREANLHEVKNTFDDIRRMDIKGRILKAVDGDGSLQKTFAENPMDFSPPPPPPPPVPVHDTVVALPEEVATEAVAVVPLVEQGPPSWLPPAVAAAGVPAPPAVPPAFVPPAIVARSDAARRAQRQFA